MKLTDFRYIVIAGPTASGKSSLALALAEALGGEIVNCDSVQVYRGFNIGSAKPSSEERERVPHHLFDVVAPHEPYDAAIYGRQAREIIEDIIYRKKIPLVVGGTGLYLRSLWGQDFHNLPKDPELRKTLESLPALTLLEELRQRDPKRAESIHPNDHYRLVRAVELCRLMGGPVSELANSDNRSAEAFKVKVDIPRKLLHQRIQERSRLMLSSGLINEVETLLKQGVAAEAKAMQSIGYKQVQEVFEGRLARENLEEAIVIASRQYAKRQETWFKKVDFDLYTAASAVSETLVKVRDALAFQE